MPPNEWTHLDRADLIKLAEGLENRIAILTGELRQTRDTLTAVLVERRAMLDNLKATQTRCTELLDQYRALRRDVARDDYRE